ncbi:carbon-nitrogen hydrolase family protein [Sphingobium algorifonticola]|uniref:Carbon-nitrogen hydrolase family protein n=1 Tax=Sphingobium algorifonticola TaxID=2008318 RepID=A0A437J6A3_9SPHN|nr:carbon-nitrogen hydrolase family protein [Sphingobium algorifonticola]RVT40334.1 carbon-nitrogen hydrolase family protein [Sphingobium algorifonticola]
MRVALFQMTSGTDPVANADALVDAIAQAKAGGADMLFTPEMAAYLDRDRARAATLLTAEADNAVLAQVRAAAARAGLWVHLGSIACAGERADGRWSNRSLMIDDSGAIRARYDKMHLFDVDLATGESWRESAVYGPGEALVTVDTPWARMGLSVCYDLRFPDLYRALTNAGATVLLIPAAFTVPTGAAHWHVLLRARAIEAGAFVIAAAQTGAHEDGRVTYGHSLVVDPWGTVLLDMGTAGGIGFADIDLAQVADVRARIPAIANRRPVPAKVTQA